MEKSKVIRYASICKEIIIYFCIGFYVITKTSKKYFIEEKQENSINNRDNPANAAFQKSSNDSFFRYYRTKGKSYL